MKKRFLTSLLCFAMLLSLIPAGLVSAASGDVATDVSKYDSIDAFKQAYTSTTGQSVMIYHAAGTNGNDSDIIQIDYGVYKMEKFQGIQYTLKFDPEAVVPANKNTTFKAMSINPVTGNVNSPNGFVYPAQIPIETVKSDEMKDYFQNTPFFPNSLTDVTDPNEMSIMSLEDVTLEVNKSASPKAFSGIVDFAIGMKTDSTPANFSTALSIIVDPPLTEEGEYTSKDWAEPLVLFSTYYKVKDATKINDQTFCTVETDNSTSGVNAYWTPPTGGGAQQKFTDLAMIGFPKAAEKTYKVKPIVYNTESKTAPLISAQVFFTGTVDGVEKRFPEGTATYTTNNDGLLMLNGELVNGNGEFDLPAGTYNYTVTPQASDAGNYSANSGTFTVNAGSDTTAQTVTMNAVIKQAGAQDYVLKVLDGESAAKDEVMKDVKVTAQGNVLALNENGEVTINQVPGNCTLKVEKTGYVEYNQTVTLNADGSIAATSITTTDGVSNLVLNQKKAAVTLEAKDGAKPLPGATVTITKDPNGVVTPNMDQNVLPITKTANTDGTVDFNLPDGTYQYTIDSAGYETVGPVSLVVKDQQVTVGGTPVVDTETGTITDVTGGTPVTSTPNEDGTGTSATVPMDTTTDETKGGAALTEITDPLYIVKGTWDNDSNPTKMTITVSLKNIDATMGVFGLKYDPAAFSLDASTGFAANTNIVQVENGFKVDNGSGTSQTVNNPTVATGYHAFKWDGYADGAAKVVDAKTAGTEKLIATYTLNVVDKTKVHSKSISVMPYTKTAAAATIKSVYAANTAAYEEFISEYWRDVDAENNAPITNPKRLDAKYALEGGFHQATSVETGDTAVEPSDVRTQIEYNDFGNIGVTFQVQEGPQDSPKGPIKNATVIVKKDGVEVGRGTTDANGEVTIGVPGDKTYTYDVKAPGYTDLTDQNLPAGTDDMNVPVYMESDLSHIVVLETTTGTKVDLLGDARAQNAKDYYFNLSPKAGFMWKDNTKPAPGDLTIKIGTSADDTSAVQIDADKITWDVLKNQYKIDADAISETTEKTIVIQVDAEKIVPTDAANGYKVTVTSGTGGTLSHAANATSTFNPDTNTNVVETLGAEQSTSAKYTFTPNGPVDSGADKTKPYRAYVIDKFLVNGTAVTLTDVQKIYGLDYQLTGITADQFITVTYKKATVDPKDPENPGDDVILDEPEPEPASNAVISVVVGDYGTASVSGTGITAGDLVGYGHADYVVDENGNIKLDIKPAKGVTQPDSTQKDYMVDTVTIDGTAVSTTNLSNIPGNVTGTWTAPAMISGYPNGDAALELTNLKKGDDHTIVITFKPAADDENPNPDPIQATVNAVVAAGNGVMQPSGVSVYTVGDMPTFTLTPNDGWVIGGLEIKAPSAAVADDVMDDVVMTGNVGAYKTPALAAGVTTLSATFTEKSFVVAITIDYAKGTGAFKPYTQPDLLFERTAGGDATVLKFTPEGQITNSVMTYQVKLPKGTWTFTFDKNGYLDYVVTGFTIADDGSCAGTKVQDSIILFGTKDTSSTETKVIPIIGDASWDGKLISMRDAAQVANGLTAGTTEEARKHRADVDESTYGQTGKVETADMTYVKDAYGSVYTNVSYTDFLK